MRLFRRIREPVEATAQVVSATAPSSHTASWSNVRMRLVVVAPGHDAFSVEHSCMCRADRWPMPGMELPVTFDARDHDRLDVDWKRVPSARERARQQAEAMVQALSGGGSAPPR
ncbi:MAG TPA: hypothetical protein VHF89_08305 [Solirubrobacteraceae bacterium]|nr:hypothetical protein [Solirubrobacteraceae bacterium]